MVGLDQQRLGEGVLRARIVLTVDLQEAQRIGGPPGVGIELQGLKVADLGQVQSAFPPSRAIR